MEALKKEWLLRLPDLHEKTIKTIYFGGGTPSLLGVEYIHTILQWIQQDIGFNSLTTEITLEANPENISWALMREYQCVGINRVSIGIQTLNEELLKKLERQHGADKALDAVKCTREAGIENITVDLMYDLPYQTLAIWEDTLSKVSTLPIKHLSLYNLTIEPHTTFFKQQEQLKPALPDSEISLQMYKMAQEIFDLVQLRQYEISAFAKEGFQSKHNTGYWIGRPFMGFGPSAFSYWQGKRFRNIAHLNRYAESLKEGRIPLDFEEQLDPKASLRELFTIRIRMIEGVNLSAFQHVYGALDNETLACIETLVHEGYLLKTPSAIQLTQKGILFYDTVATELI